MKKWFAVLLVLIVGAVIFVGAPAMANNGIDASSQWALTYCWDGAPCGNATWFVTYPTFTSDDGGSGTVSLTLRPLTVCLNYDIGCFPAYCTQQIDRNAGTASGEMTGQGCHGTWSASRICLNCQAPAPSAPAGVSSSGR